MTWSDNLEMENGEAYKEGLFFERQLWTERFAVDMRLVHSILNFNDFESRAKSWISDENLEWWIWIVVRDGSGD